MDYALTDAAQSSDPVQAAVADDQERSTVTARRFDDRIGGRSEGVGDDGLDSGGVSNRFRLLAHGPTSFVVGAAGAVHEADRGAVDLGDPRGRPRRGP